MPSVRAALARIEADSDSGSSTPVAQHISHRQTWGWTAGAMALALAGLAQYLLDERTSTDLAGVAYVVAGIAWAVTMRGWMPTRYADKSARGETREWLPQPGMLRWALGFGAVAVVALGGNRFNALGIVAWMLGMGYVWLATGRRDRATEHSPWALVGHLTSRAGVRLPWTSLLLGLAMAAGAFIRLYRLRELPADLGWDLPYNYTDAQRVLSGEYPIFFTANYGREGMFFYIIALVARVGSLSPYSIRVASALAGIATIPAVFALARECADDTTAAMASLLLAINKWHVVLTRSGYRVSLMPLFATLALYGLARALRRGHARDWAITGLFLGLGLWTYKAFLFVVPTVAAIGMAYLGLGAVQGRGRRVDVSRGWGDTPCAMMRGAALLVAAMLIAWAPMLRFVIDEPQTYMARELHGASLVDQSLDEASTSRFALYVRNAWVSALMFNYEGDGNSRFGVPFQRHFGFVSGVLFFLGLAAALGRWRRGANLLLIIGLVGTVMPMTVSMLAGEKPNCFRSSGAIGLATVLAATLLVAILRAAQHALDGLPRKLRVRLGTAQSPDRVLSLSLRYALVPLLITASLLWGETRETWRFYFQAFRRVAPDAANYSIAQEMSRQILAFADGPAYTKSWPHWYDGRAVQAHVDAGGGTWAGDVHDLSAGAPPLSGFRGKALFLLHPDDRASLNVLTSAFSRHAVLVDHDPLGAVPMLIFYGQR